MLAGILQIRSPSGANGGLPENKWSALMVPLALKQVCDTIKIVRHDITAFDFPAVLTAIDGILFR